MNALKDRLRRDVIARWGQTLALALIVAVVVALAAGGYRARRLLEGTRDAWTGDLALADVELQFSPVRSDLRARALEVPGVVDVEQRLLLPARLTLPDGRSVPALLRGLPARAAPELNRLHLLAGRLPAPEEAALVVDRSVARVHGVTLGQSLRLEVEGQTLALPVVGSALTPEHLLFPLHPEYALPARGALAVVFVSDAALRAVPRVFGMSDSLLVRLSPGADAAAARDGLFSALDLSPLGSTTRAEQPALRLIEVILAVFDVYLPPVTGVLGAVSLCLASLAVLRTVRRRRGEIGTLLGLGHGRWSVACSFLPVAWVPTAAGSALGALLQRPLAVHIFGAYEGSLGWAPLRDPGPGLEVPLAVAACLLVATLAALLPALSATRRTPQRLMRGRGGDLEGRGPLARAVPPLARALRLPASVSLGLSNVARRPGSTTASVLGLGALFTVVIAFVVVHLTYERETVAAARRVGLDAVVRFAEPLGSTSVDALALRVGGSAEPVVSRLGRMTDARGAGPVRVVGAPTDGAWLSRQRIVVGRGLSSAALPGAPAELLLDRWVADERGLTLGSRVSLFPGVNAPEGLEATVVGIVEGLSAVQVYVALERARELFGMPDLSTGAQVSVGPGPLDVEAALSAQPGVERVFPLTQAIGEVLAGFEGGRQIVGLALLMAIAVAVLFLGVTASMDGSERAPDVAVLHAVGWTDRSLLALALTEVLLRGLLAAAVGITAAPHLARALLARLAEANHFPMVAEVPAWLPLTLLGVTALALPLAALPAWRTSLATPPMRTLRAVACE